ncbi:MAG TPA: DUF2231 domain-containing protein [Thermoanaerobaculaceae bacterium]|nr:DUF2231 domain-containing protein [Thermoanaerobaculaceae bacterium]HPS78102.1 DUF2231 domain-containing protein [Thermoanaerobaculaceae bacterium]
MSWLPDPLHPALVHFPIVLAMVALLFDLVARLRKGSGGACATALLALAAAGSVATVLSGQAAHEAAVVPPAARALVARHEQLGELVMYGLLALLSARGLLAWRRWRHPLLGWGQTLLLAVVVGLVALTGHLGGELVFVHGVGTAPVQRSR